MCCFVLPRLVFFSSTDFGATFIGSEEYNSLQGRQHYGGVPKTLTHGPDGVSGYGQQSLIPGYANKLNTISLSLGIRI